MTARDLLLFLLPILLLLSHSYADHDAGADGANCGIYDLCTGGPPCGADVRQCECDEAYGGWNGGLNPFSVNYPTNLAAEHACGSFSIFPEPVAVPYDTRDCASHCHYNLHDTLCASHGTPQFYYEARNGLTHQYPFNYDFFTYRYWCRCQPGWIGTFNGTFVIGSLPYQGRLACYQNIRDFSCSGHGRDASGPAVGEGICAGIVNGIYQSTGCGKSYFSYETFSPGLINCLCDAGYMGNTGEYTQCSVNVATDLCSGNGVDSHVGQRYANETPPVSDVNCTCNTGYITSRPSPPLFGGYDQCNLYAPCTNYSCGGPARGNCSTAGVGCSPNPTNPKGRCCVCNTAGGYGGSFCCPLQHQTGLPCNGIGTCIINGECDCPLGSQQPGCCVGCDASQACRPDGRCACPVLNGTICGTRGSSCNDATQRCTCQSVSWVSSDLNITVNTGGIYCCPIQTATGMLCSGRGTCTSTPHPDFPGTGGCQCFNSSFAGAFCCPKAAGQSKECGVNGRCMPDGKCYCDPGVTGAACQFNSNCRTADTKNECSGGGSCLRMTQGNYGFGNLFEVLRYDDHPNTIYVCHDNTCNYTDEGLIFFIQDYYKDFLGIDLREQVNEGQYYPQNFTACASGIGAGRGQCLWNVLTACHPQRDAFIATFAGAFPYVTDFVFPSLHPSRNVNNAPLFLQAAQAFASPNPCTSSNTSLVREAQAALMTYEVVFRKTGQPITPPGQAQTNLNAIQMLPTSLEGYPYQCTCTPPPGNSIIGFQTTPSGVYCQLQCLVGGTSGEVPHLQACSGFIHGQARGYCADQYGDPKGFGTVAYDPDNPVPVPGTCICNPRFAGSACQYSRSPGCIPLESTSDTPCTSTQRGTCLQTQDLQQQPVFSCNCSAQFTGTYCELSRCQPPGQSPTETECNNRGVCQVQGGLFQCNCNDYNSGTAQTGSGNIIPFLAGGLACEVNVTAGCGTFRAGIFGGGAWELCSGAGQCVVSYTTPPTAACVCDTGRGGIKCRDTACNPTCNARQTCTNSTGACACKPFWGPPPVGTCATNNRTCECSVNLCIHGTSDAAGQVCTCDPGWKKVPFGQTGISGGIAGSCDIVQCPLVVHNDQGIRLCNEPSDPRCSDLSSISQSLASGCCVDSCPSCSINATDGSRICNCGAGVGVAACFVSTLGACFPKCHGNDLALANPPNCISPGPPPMCNCAAVTLASNQFVDATCLRYTCSHGTRFGTSCIPQQQQCCDCTGTAFTGSLCSETNCGGRGTPNANNTACNCYEPFYRGPGRSDCNLDRCTPGTVTGFTPNFQCNCPSTTIVGSGSLSCISLDCAGIHAAQCASCIHGTPTIQNFAFKCDCTGTTYTGADCNTAVCQNGGTPQPAPNQFNCTCPFPYSGQFCAGNRCLNGGTPATGKCNCPTAWTGDRCQTPAGTPSSTVPSSTGGGGNTGDTGEPTPTPSPSSSSSSALSTGAIIGMAAGGGVLLLIGCAVAVNKNSSSSLFSSSSSSSSREQQMRRRQALFEDTDAVPSRLQEQIQLLETNYANPMPQQQPSDVSTAQRLLQQLQRLEALQKQQPKLDITANL
jgi:hypothetical protein